MESTGLEGQKAVALVRLYQLISGETYLLNPRGTRGIFGQIFLSVNFLFTVDFVIYPSVYNMLALFFFNGYFTNCFRFWILNSFTNVSQFPFHLTVIRHFYL